MEATEPGFQGLRTREEIGSCFGLGWARGQTQEKVPLCKAFPAFLPIYILQRVKAMVPSPGESGVQEDRRDFASPAWGTQ